MHLRERSRMPLFISQEAFDVARNQAALPVQRVPNFLDGGLHVVTNLLQRRPANQIQQIFFAADVVVQRSFLDTEQGRDFTGARGGVTLSREEPDRGVQRASKSRVLPLF